MFTKSRKDTLVEQAQDLASDISEAIAPHVERARDEVAPRLADAHDALSPKIADAKDAIGRSWPTRATRPPRWSSLRGRSWSRTSCRP